MNEEEKLLLQEMCVANNVENQTQNIRNLKHSGQLRENIDKLLAIMKETRDPKEVHMEAMIECSFLVTYYTDIYNRIRKEEIDLSILFQFLTVLEKIEKGECDQHEASFEIGTLLKKIYIDSALKKAEKLDKEHASEATPNVVPENISWKAFKNR